MLWCRLLLLLVLTGPVQATMLVSPQDNEVLYSDTITLVLDLDPAVELTRIRVGPSLNSNQYLATEFTGNTITVTGLPTDGSTIHLRVLFNLPPNNLFPSEFYTFTAWDGVSVPPTDPTDPTDPTTITGEVIFTTGMTNEQMGPIIQSILLIFVVAFGFRMILRQLR